MRIDRFLCFKSEDPQQPCVVIESVWLERDGGGIYEDLLGFYTVLEPPN